MFAHLIRQRAWQLDGEHHVGLGNFNPSSSHGLLHVPACLTDRHAVPTGHRASGGNGGHPRPDQIGGGVDPPGVLDAIDTITPNHVMNILPIMTPPTPWARKTLQPPVAERHLEAEVAHCVGGVASPLLMNVALHGMEVAAGVRYYDTGTNAGKTVPNCPVVVRYADDLIALCHSRAQAEQVKARLAEWLAPRGLGFNQAKTQITHRRDLSFPRFSGGRITWFQPSWPASGCDSSRPRTRRGCASRGAVGCGAGCTTRRCSGTVPARPPHGYGSWCDRPARSSGWRRSSRPARCHSCRRPSPSRGARRRRRGVG